MPSARSIGTKFQKWVKDWLEPQGWMVYNKMIGGRYEKKRDIFGCDLIAKHPNFGATVWIQATADSAANIKRKTVEIRTVPWKIPKIDRVFVFIKRESKRVDVLEFKTLATGGAYTTVKIGHIVNGTWYSRGGSKFKWDR